MSKRKVREDFLGVWVSAGGYVTRPMVDTKYKKGESVKASHMGGSTMAKVGDEIWMTTGLVGMNYSKYTKQEVEDAYRYAVEHFSPMFVGDYLYSYDRAKGEIVKKERRK